MVLDVVKKKNLFLIFVCSGVLDQISCHAEAQPYNG